MNDALAGNPTLDEVLSRLRLASAVVETQNASLLPQIAIDAQEQPSRLSGAYTIPPPYAGSDRRVGTIQSSLSWTLDFAGKQHALISQTMKSADAAALDVAAARVALAGAVARTFVALARAEEQMRIAEAFVHSRQESLVPAHTRSRNDLASDFDIRAAETLLAQAQQSLDKAKSERALMTHALAALAGRGADAYAGVTSPVPRFDAALPLPASPPANLLERRPDILAAKARISAASAGREAARADFYPIMLPLLVQGVAMSAFFMAMLTISLEGVAPERVPSATGISNFARITGASFAASIFTTAWDRRESLHQSRLSDVSSPFSQVFELGTRGLGGMLSDHQAAGVVAQQMVAQAYLLSSIELFWICGWLSFAMIGLVWLAKRPAAHDGPIAAD